jgi:sensor histidine kinase YesM
MLTLSGKYSAQNSWLHTYANSLLANNPANNFKGFRRLHTWLVIPILGITIPLLTGLLEPQQFSHTSLLIQYLLFVGVAELIYKGNMYFLKLPGLLYKAIKMPFAKLVIISFMVNIVYSGTVAAASLSTWNLYIVRKDPFSNTVIITMLVILVFVLFINNLYQLNFLRAQQKQSAEKMALLDHAKKQAELQSLNSELDPHFLYNALTSLSYHIQKNPLEADQLNARLASLYRYVLKNKCTAFVPLSQEIEFCKAYFSLQQLRFGNAILLQVINGDEKLQRIKIPPLAVQSLVENALKHNQFSERQPLVVQVHIGKENIRVTNRIQPAPYAKPTNGTGLNNLNKRLLLLIQQPLRVERSNNCFSVSIPLIA